MSIHNAFGDLLRRLRRDHDLTQEGLAELAGCAVDTLRAIESGRRRPSRAMAERLAAVLAVPATERNAFLLLARGVAGVAPEEVEPPPVRLASEPPPGAPAPAAQQLAVSPLPLIGRAAEREMVARLLRDPTCRLVTLVGPGGIGKTRLSAQLARDLAGAFPQGVASVALAAVERSSEAVAAVGAALGVPVREDRGLIARIVEALRGRSLLLVLDNVEQLLQAQELIELIGAIIEEAPGVRLLATSREQLRLRGEWVVEIGGLGLPSPGDALPSDAVLLFLERARRFSSGFVLTGEKRAEIARICELLEGAPLGIELAAAWVTALTPAEIAAEIARDLDFLALAARDTPPRHRSMRAVFEGSWRLLSPHERDALARLALFRGGFTRDAAGAVTGATLPLLAELVQKSLVRREGDGRYGLHEVIRHYSGQHLAADPGTLAAARAAHATYFLDLVGRTEPALKGSGQSVARRTLAADAENIRLAWRHAVAAQDWGAIAAAVDGLFLFCDLQSLYEDAEEAFARAAAEAALSPEAGSALQAKLLACEGWFALNRYRFEHAQRTLARSLDVINSLGPGPETLFAELLTLVQPAVGGKPAPREVREALLGRVRAGGDRWLLAYALGALAFVEPSIERATPLVEESLALSRELGDPQRSAASLDDLASLAKANLEIGKARRYWTEALALYREQGARWAYTFCLDKLGYTMREQGELDEAERLHRESLETSRILGDRLGVAGSLDNLALVALDAGRLDEAERLANEGLAIRRAVGHASSILISYLRLAAVKLARGELSVARIHLAASMAHLPENASWHHSRIQSMLARVELAEGDVAGATARLRAYLVDEYFSLEDVLFLLAPLAWARLLAGDEDGAAELAAAVLAAGGELVVFRSEAERLLATVAAPTRVRGLRELAAAWAS